VLDVKARASTPVDGRPLAELGPLAPEEIAGVAAAVATLLAELHEAGKAHGRVDATEVVIAPDGQALLRTRGPGGTPADDVAAVGHLMSSLLATARADGRGRSGLRNGPGWMPFWRPEARDRGREGPVRRDWRGQLGPMLAPPAAPTLAALAAEACADDPNRRPSARALATAISEQVPTARLPVPGAGRLLPLMAPLRRGRSRRWLGRGAPVAAGVLALVLVLALVARKGPSGPAEAPAEPAPAEPAPAHPAGAPPTLVALPPVQFENGVLTFQGARYAVGRPGDLVAVGDWACTGSPTPILLRPSSGELFAFDAWAGPAKEVRARALGQVEHAVGVRAVRAAGPEPCDQVEVRRSQGPPVRLPVSP
jgi:hypothetical protein